MLTALGIDPGTTGAFALLIGPSALVFDMPVSVSVKRGKVRTRVDEAEALALGRRLAEMGPEAAAIEAVQGSAGQSAPAAFTFGYGTAVAAMAVRAAGIPLERVAPVTWKMALGLKDDADGSRARELAARLYPDAAADLVRKKHHNRADAILIAHWARITHATHR